MGRAKRHGATRTGHSPVHNEVIRRRANTGQEEALPHGVGNELRPNEGEHTKDREDHQHQHNAEGDYAFFRGFTSDVPRHALQCNGARHVVSKATLNLRAVLADAGPDADVLEALIARSGFF